MDYRESAMDAEETMFTHHKALIHANISILARLGLERNPA